MTLPSDTRWDALPDRLRAEGITNKLVTSDGRVWHLTGPHAGAEGALINGPIDGLGTVRGKGVWSETANGAPRFERWVDERAEIAFRALLLEDSAFGWYATRRRFLDGLSPTVPSWWSVTTRRFGEVWVPVLRDSENVIYEDDPTVAGDNFSIHELVLAVSGNPRWRRPDFAGMFKNTGSEVGSIRVINRSDTPQWAYFICEGGGRVRLPDGPNAVITDERSVELDLPGILGLFRRGERTPRGVRSRREANTVIDVTLGAEEHTLIDTDPTHRLAIADTDPVDNGWLQFIRNSELLSLLTGNAGERGVTVLERLRGQGFSVPIPARSEATLPVAHSKPGGRIWCLVPQRFDHAF
ncbi:minor tail protein [Gordonia phage DelRio]|uniref:Minor tail protein n=7 Tax=Betterkatzvirus betterkatz TaxID=2560485 RepID=A0A2Z5HDD4_9CAUD|nr:minor tail protein [Gordonia phage BetterKatz]AXC38099.1 minor tail protein [Gordonia phage Nadeem]AXH47242.1 minor tail protein [Gordonia phage DelRio]AZS11189.1 minor tail protein [Gordonia phage WheatThin]QAU06819.1 minor tail protein [Gordonia phage Brylie]QAX92517.1 minor tail protein [Gordonia phage Mulch]QAY06478.1 minor tail protein [Gordonia phage Parada]QPL13896.1 minor tail protein [Gordonia phage NancyRae]QXO14162.1 minor tail protein [Gordonia phage Bock]